jgi:FtsZ-binding cell division protein ZapB
MSKYEVKLVNIGEEVDNRIRELEIEVKDIRKANDNLTRANESYRQENIDMRKENFGVEVAMLTKEVDDLKKRNDFFEKLFSQHRYVFSEIPNTEENMKMVKLMKKHINKDRYTVRWRGQYLIDGEDWKKYTDGQPMNKSKCIRVYIDSKGDDTTEGFKESEVDAIKEGLDLLINLCEENLRSWCDYTPDEDVNNEKKTLETARQLLSYFTSMSIHLEESKLARAEIVNQNLSASK